MNRHFAFPMNLLLALAALTALGLPGAAQADPPAVVVSGAWSRPAVETGVVYATLRNNGSAADRLIGASSPLADHVGLHQTYRLSVQSAAKPMDGMPADDMLTSMRAVSSISIPAHGTTLLSPGGYHLMLDLRRQIAAGETIPLRLHFARAGWIATRVVVRGIR
jgi:copper(I)-binding protein